MSAESISHTEYNAEVSQAYLDSMPTFQGNLTQAAIADLSQEIAGYAVSKDKIFFTELTAYARQVIQDKLSDPELDENLREGYLNIENSTIASSLAWMAMDNRIAKQEAPEMPKAPQYLAPGS